MKSNDNNNKNLTKNNDCSIINQSVNLLLNCLLTD